MSTRNVREFNFIKISWLRDDWKWAWGIDRGKMNSSRRTIKKRQFLMGERYHCTFIDLGLGLKIFSICLKIQFSQLLRELKRQLRIVLCKENPNDLIYVLAAFSVTLQP